MEISCSRQYGCSLLYGCVCLSGIVLQCLGIFNVFNRKFCVKSNEKNSAINRVYTWICWGVFTFHETADLARLLRTAQSTPASTVCRKASCWGTQAGPGWRRAKRQKWRKRVNKRGLSFTLKSFIMPLMSWYEHSDVYWKYTLTVGWFSINTEYRRMTNVMIKWISVMLWGHFAHIVWIYLQTLSSLPG